MSGPTAKVCLSCFLTLVVVLDWQANDPSSRVVLHTDWITQVPSTAHTTLDEPFLTLLTDRPTYVCAFACQLMWVEDLSLLLSASMDGTVALVDVRKRAALRVFDGHAKTLPIQVR